MKFAAIDIRINAVRLLVGEVDFATTNGFVKKHSYRRIPYKLISEIVNVQTETL